MTKERFINPFDLPGELKQADLNLDIRDVPVALERLADDLYDLDLHDEFDWLAQPCVPVPSVPGSSGRINEG